MLTVSENRGFSSILILILLVSLFTVVGQAQDTGEFCYNTESYQDDLPQQRQQYAEEGGVDEICNNIDDDASAKSACVRTDESIGSCKFPVIGEERSLSDRLLSDASFIYWNERSLLSKRIEVNEDKARLYLSDMSNCFNNEGASTIEDCADSIDLSNSPSEYGMFISATIASAAEFNSDSDDSEVDDDSEDDQNLGEIGEQKIYFYDTESGGTKLGDLGEEVDLYDNEFIGRFVAEGDNRAKRQLNVEWDGNSKQMTGQGLYVTIPEESGKRKWTVDGETTFHIEVVGKESDVSGQIEFHPFDRGESGGDGDSDEESDGDGDGTGSASSGPTWDYQLEWKKPGLLATCSLYVNKMEVSKLDQEGEVSLQVKQSEGFISPNLEPSQVENGAATFSSDGGVGTKNIIARPIEFRIDGSGGSDKPSIQIENGFPDNCDKTITD